MVPGAVREVSETIGRSVLEETVDAEDVESTRLEQEQFRVIHDLAKRVAKMEPEDSSTLRGTQACNVLSCGARALHWLNQDLYEFSFPVPVIQDFWSHSWHGSLWLKRLLLLLLYNGPAATILASLSAFGMMCLHTAGFLPGFERGTRGALEADAKLVFAPWCTLTGGLVFTIVLFSWRSRRLVFFDQICINQYDQDLKFKGIVNIGAFLNYSQNFLLIWDETFAGRLWCMLELAAFLTSHENAEATVLIRPTAMAPCIFIVSLAIWALFLQWTLFDGEGFLDILLLFMARWVSSYVCSAYLRAHYRNSETMLGQMGQFTLESVDCLCCKRKHRKANGCRMICDRAVMVECLRIWYGSVETFEEMVRKRIRSMLYRQLGGLLFPYGWQLVGASPILWGFADLVAARTRVGHWREAAYLGVGALTFWLVLFPFVFQVTLLLANFFCQRAGSVWLDQLKTISVAFLLTLLSFIGNATMWWVHDPFTASLWVGGSMLLFAVTWMALRLQVRQLEDRLAAEDGFAGVLTKRPRGE